MMKAIVAVGALAIALLPAVSNVSAARPAGFNYWAHEAYSLRDSKTFIIHGDRLSKGCSINHPPIENSDDGSHASNEILRSTQSVAAFWLRKA